MRAAAFGEIMLRLTSQKGIMIPYAEDFKANFGGGESNVLISLSKFDIDTRMITKVSSNDMGDGILAYLKSHNVDTNYIRTCNKRTGIYFLQIGSGNRASKVIYDRSDSAFSTFNEDDLNIEEALNGVDLFHFSGVTLALSSDIRKVIIKILKYCKDNNILVSYDSNYRSKLWSLDEASNATEEILPYVNIFSAGILDAENILHMKCDAEDKYEKIKYYYNEISKKYSNIKYIYSSMRDILSSSVNELQCLLYSNNCLYTSEIIRIDDIVDRVGGGDALSAGIIYSILNKKDPMYCVNFAVNASVLKHSIYGDANLIKLNDVENLMNHGIEKINR